ncbi:c-type cytochrome [Billgrantia sp. Q4P2]|uniref:c-type cytochrome n=1 Tax=Billgrantia sp. Q4P2 TaxID=3463857 RepID=UPI00405627C4
MKSSKLILGCLATVGLTVGAVSAQAEVDRDAIAERLKPVGQLCLQGDECGTAAAAAGGGAEAGGNGVDGAGIYNQVCMACHDTGAAGAPRRGEEGEWAERIDQGWETLLDHAINGFNAMPARGGNPNLSDEEVAAATAHLLEPVMDVPEVGGEEATDDEAQAEDAAADEAVTEEGAVDDEAEAAAVAAEDASADDEASGDEAAAADSDIDGEAIYNQACMACHMTGAAGAPRRGEAGEWEGRIDQDIETLYDHAINGIGAMPPKGGHTNLSDDEVRAAVDFLVEPIQ